MNTIGHLDIHKLVAVVASSSHLIISTFGHLDIPSRGHGSCILSLADHGGHLDTSLVDLIASSFHLLTDTGHLDCDLMTHAFSLRHRLSVLGEDIWVVSSHL